MKRTLLSVALGLSALLAPAAAAAQDGVQRGTLVFGAERLTGLYFYSFKTQQQVQLNNNTTGTVDVTTSGTQFNLLWGNSQSSATGVNPAAIPRLGVDYMLTELISLGGSAGYMSSSGSTKSGNVSVDAPSLTGFAVAPRIGFALRISDSFLFWPRVGFAYLSSKTESNGNNNRTTTVTLYDAVVEGMFVYSPVPHFGFGFGPMLELGLGGSAETKVNGVSNSVDASMTNYGVIAGLVGYL